MTFIGAQQVPAPKLKDAILSRNQLESAYEQCTQVLHFIFIFCIFKRINKKVDF